MESGGGYSEGGEWYSEGGDGGYGVGWGREEFNVYE